jgi:Mrp family chromosome partitioning ATPase
MTEARQKFDLVLVDAPAAVVSGDWQTLANHVDASVLVVRCMQEERGLVSRLIAQLRDARPTHLGVIINAVRSEAGGYLKRNLKQMDQYQRAQK